MLFTKNTAISPQQAHQIMEESDNFVLLDVRMPSEYKQVRINGAKLLPLDEIQGRASKILPDKNIPVLVYCHSGMRAEKAVKMLTRMGYTNVLSFGGIINWPYETVRG